MTTPLRSWQPILERRIALVIATIALPVVASFASSRWGVWVPALAFAAWLTVLFWLRAAACPECGKQFLSRRLLPFSASCGSCGARHNVPASAAVPSTGGSLPLEVKAASELSMGQRKFVGGAIALAGAAALIGHGIWPNRSIVSWWQQLFFVSFAGLAMLGGTALYRGVRSGYPLARTVLIAQILGFVVPGAAYQVLAGPYGIVRARAGAVGFEIGWESSFVVWVGETTGWMIDVNLLALLLLAFIPRASPPTPDAASAT